MATNKLIETVEESEWIMSWCGIEQRVPKGKLPTHLQRVMSTQLLGVQWRKEPIKWRT